MPSSLTRFAAGVASGKVPAVLRINSELFTVASVVKLSSWLCLRLLLLACVWSPGIHAAKYVRCPRYGRNACDQLAQLFRSNLCCTVRTRQATGRACVKNAVSVTRSNSEVEHDSNQRIFLTIITKYEYISDEQGVPANKREHATQRCCVTLLRNGDCNILITG
jgi:hypothetical protein